MPTAHGDPDLEATVLAFIEVGSPVLCPEVRLQLKPPADTFERFRSRLPAAYSAVPPYWSVAWPGGQALARYVLDNPSVFGRNVADIGTGSGLAAIAAMMSGALSARAIDCDPLALVAAGANSRLNHVSIDVARGDLATTNLEGVHVVLAGDLWYEPFIARQATTVLRTLAQQGILVLAGDPRRSYFQRSRRELLATYEITASEELERASVVAADVWQLLP